MIDNRFTLRFIDRDEHGSVCQFIEQEIPADEKNIELALRRKHFRRLVASCLLSGGVVTIERKVKP